MSQADGKYPEILLDLRDALTEILVEAGADRERAGQLAEAAAERIRQRWGGRQLYIGKGEEWENDARNREIYRQFNGRNYEQLMVEHDLTERRLRQIINHVRAEEIARRQIGLF